MSKKIIYLTSVSTVKDVYLAIKSSHHGFPIVNMNGQVIGLISQNFLITILMKRVYYS